MSLDEALLSDLDAWLLQDGPHQTRFDLQLRLQKSHGPDLDAAVSQRFRGASANTRVHAFGPLLDHLAVGPLLQQALLDTVIQANVRKIDAISANVALRLLEPVGAQLSKRQWIALGHVAREERVKVLPDREVAVVIARAGPAESLPSVTLAVFRQGPEDADDRLVSASQLGRFADSRVVPWLIALAKTGTAGLECLYSAANSSYSVTDLLTLLAGVSASPGLDSTDCWVRWSAIDGICHRDAQGALPLLLAIGLAGGDDLEPWFLDFCQQRAQTLANSKQTLRQIAAKHNALPQILPLVGLKGRVMSRCPRVARSAMAEWQRNHEAEIAGDLLVEHRANVEKTLYLRDQLCGSLVAQHATQTLELDAVWAPNWLALTDADRANLAAEEAAWLAS